MLPDPATRAVGITQTLQRLNEGDPTTIFWFVVIVVFAVAASVMKFKRARGS